jgi:hypothetical protein
VRWGPQTNGGRRGIKSGPVMIRLVAAIIPDDELVKRTEEDIIQYKRSTPEAF